MLKQWYPDELAESAYDLDYEKLYRDGIRGLIYDIDNTLVPHGAPADGRALSLMERLRKIGFSVCFVSNNDRARVESFNRDIGAFFVENAHKPSREGYNKAMRAMRTDPGNTLCVGDQIFTDTWGANRAGLPFILVRPIDKKEEIQIVLKRRLERIVLFFYRRSRQRSGA